MSLWEQALKHNLNTIWIIEDDADIKSNPNIISGLIKHLDKVDPEWDLLYTDENFWNNFVAYPTEKRKKFVVNAFRNLPMYALKQRRFPNVQERKYYSEEKIVSPYLKKVHARWGLHSVVFSKRGLKKLVNYFHKVKVILPVDGEIFLVPGIRMYSVRNDIVGQNFKTTISDTRFNPNDK